MEKPAEALKVMEELNLKIERYLTEYFAICVRKELEKPQD
jgi:hypothetical protein